MTAVALQLAVDTRLNLLTMYKNLDLAAVVTHIGLFIFICMTGEAAFIGDDAFTGGGIKTFRRLFSQYAYAVGSSGMEGLGPHEHEQRNYPGGVPGNSFRHVVSP
jgi:hypothetical protein